MNVELRHKHSNDVCLEVMMLCLCTSWIIGAISLVNLPYNISRAGETVFDPAYPSMPFHHGCFVQQDWMERNIE